MRNKKVLKVVNYSLFVIGLLMLLSVTVMVIANKKIISPISTYDDVTIEYVTPSL